MELGSKHGELAFGSDVSGSIFEHVNFTPYGVSLQQAESPG